MLILFPSDSEVTLKEFSGWSKPEVLSSGMSFDLLSACFELLQLLGSRSRSMGLPSPLHSDLSLQELSDWTKAEMLSSWGSLGSGLGCIELV